MAAQKIRIRLKAFDYRLIDQSAQEIVEMSTVVASVGPILHVIVKQCVFDGDLLTRQIQLVVAAAPQSQSAGLQVGHLHLKAGSIGEAHDGDERRDQQ